VNLRAATTTATLRHWDHPPNRRTSDTDSLADEELLERVSRERDEDAFGMLYARYARAVYALVVRVLRCDPTSEDAAQKAFTAVWRKAGGYHAADGNAIDWMFTVTRAAAIDAGRARVPPQAEEPRDRPNRDWPDDEVMAELEAFRMHHALDSLPDPERAVIELTYFQGLAPNETAAHLDLPLVTAQMLRRNGLQRMARMLTRPGDPGASDGRTRSGGSGIR
jgi:RNA polymerase sigma-70 factor, ECF subfamily